LCGDENESELNLVGLLWRLKGTDIARDLPAGIDIEIMIEVDGDNAYAETYFSAYHRMRAKGDPLAASNAYDTEMDFLVGGRYIDRFQRREGVWKISHRTGLTDWTRVEPPSSQGFSDTPAELQGQRGAADLVFRSKDVYQ
jgi:hypothetical protein